MAERSLKLIADNSAFVLARMMSGPWAGLVQNTQHIVQDRGRASACGSYDLRLVGVTPVEVARFNFDATPLETACRVCPIITVQELVAELDITVLIESEDTAGGNTASDSYTVPWRRPRRPFGEYGELYGGPESRLAYPLDPTQMRGSESYELGWFAHTFDAALPTKNRVVKVSLATSSVDGTLINMLCRGVAIAGYRG